LAYRCQERTKIKKIDGGKVEYKKTDKTDYRVTDQIAGMMWYMALLTEYRAFLIERGALLIEYRAPLIECRALLIEYMALLIAYMALLIPLVKTAAVSQDIGLFGWNMGLLW